MQFGPILRMMRKRAGLSQEELAEMIHISRSNISRLESDIYELKASDLFRWANATNAQDVLIALTLSIDMGVAQQILDMISTMSLVGTILGGIFL